MEGARCDRVQAQVELVVPAKLEPRARQLIVPGLSGRVALQPHSVTEWGKGECLTRNSLACIVPCTHTASMTQRSESGVLGNSLPDQPLNPTLNPALNPNSKA